MLNSLNYTSLLMKNKTSKWVSIIGRLELGKLKLDQFKLDQLKLDQFEVNQIKFLGFYWGSKNMLAFRFNLDFGEYFNFGLDFYLALGLGKNLSPRIEPSFVTSEYDDINLLVNLTNMEVS